jgi:hypothetical protein
LCAILENPLVLAEDIFVSWAVEHLRAPQHTQIYVVPEGERDAAQPVKYVVNATQELIGLEKAVVRMANLLLNSASPWRAAESAS